MDFSSSNLIGPSVVIDPTSRVAFSSLEYVHVGPGCLILHSHLRGCPERPLVIREGTEILQTHVEATPRPAGFSFGAWSLPAPAPTIGPASRFHQSRLVDAQIGASCEGFRCSVFQSVVGDRCNLRNHSSLTLTFAASSCNLGSEVSKSILEGPGFVSEHQASYLSLVAPTTYPILTPEGREALLTGLPNLTNIGAGTVFANYSGKPLPAGSLDASPGSQKGTALVWGAFTAVNSVIVNRYGQPSAGESLFDLLRRKDLTTLGLGCLVEKKVTGRVPAFSYAASPSAKSIEIGWILDRRPGILLNILKKMQKQLGAQAGRMKDLVEGTLRLERQLLEEEKKNPKTFFSSAQIEDGLRRFQTHLDGRWAIDDEGRLQTAWFHDDERRLWTPRL